jgi:hypothetical protein
MWARVANYTRKNPAKIAGYLSALILYINKHFPSLPIDIIIPSVMLMIGMGESAQKMENKKALKALYTDNDPSKPDEDILSDIYKQ